MDSRNQAGYDALWNGTSAFEILMTADYEDSRYTLRGMLDVSVMEPIIS